MKSTSKTNPIKTLLGTVRKHFPSIGATLESADPAGTLWYLNLKFNGYPLVVDWSSKGGFGILAGRAPEYGESADEIVFDYKGAVERVLALLEGGIPTRPKPVGIRTIRKQRKFTQEKLAAKMSVRQGAIAKLEKKDDLRLSTLQSLIGAMGGRLSMKVSFPDGSVRDLKLSGQGRAN